jgi:uncharacterized protein YjiS (DUF1127 family)
MATAHSIRTIEHTLGPRVADVVQTLRERLHKHRAYRRTLNELQGMSRRELADLGLNPTMLRSIAWETVYGGK